jgi:hypothetical protein
MVETDVGPIATLTGDLLEDVDHLVGIDGPRHFGGQRLAGELVDDVQDLDRSPIARLVELEVCCPDDVRADRAHRARCDADPSQWLFSLPMGNTQAFFSPETVDGLVIHPPAAAACHSCRTSPSPAWSSNRELAQEYTQRELVV